MVDDVLGNGDEHGDRAIYCQDAERYLLGRTCSGKCPFCGIDLTGERFERLQDRIDELAFDGGDVRR